MGEWTNFDVFSAPPPHCVDIEVEEEITTVYIGGRVEQRVRVIKCWYDKYLNRFSTAWGTLRGRVLRWRIAEVTTVDAGGNVV